MNTRIVTIIGGVFIFGIFIFASFNESSNAIEQKKVEAIKAHQEELKHQATIKKAEIEKAETEKLKHKAEIKRLQQKAKEKKLQDSREKCKDYLSLLDGRFNKATGKVWDDDNELEKIQQDAINYKYKCKYNKQAFQDIIDKCNEELK